MKDMFPFWVEKIKEAAENIYLNIWILRALFWIRAENLSDSELKTKSDILSLWAYNPNKWIF